MYEDGTMDDVERRVTELLERYALIISSEFTGPGAGDPDPDDSEFKVWQELVELVKGYEE